MLRSPAMRTHVSEPSFAHMLGRRSYREDGALARPQYAPATTELHKLLATPVLMLHVRELGHVRRPQAVHDAVYIGQVRGGDLARRQLPDISHGAPAPASHMVLTQWSTRPARALCRSTSLMSLL